MPSTTENNVTIEKTYCLMCYAQCPVECRVLDPHLHPEVVVGEEGWWQACPELGLPGYDVLSAEGGNINLVIDDDVLDPVSGSVAMRGRPCEVRAVDEA